MYYQLVQKVERKEKDQSNFIVEVKRMISHELDRASFKKYEVQGRSNTCGLFIRTIS